MRRKTKDIIRTILITIVLIFISLFFIFPFYWMILNSFKQPEDILKIPVDIFTFDLTLKSYEATFNFVRGYVDEFNYATIWTAYLNSFIIAITSTLGTLFTSSLAAFAFAKLKFKGSKALYTIFIATLMIPGQVTVIPLYTMFAKLHLVDTFIPLILPGVMINTYGVFMLRSFIVSIPNELLDAAEVDGCGYFRKYIKIILPLIKPALVTLGLFSFIGSWNNYFGQLIYISSYSNYTIPLIINAFKDPYMGGVEWGRLMAATTLSVVPIAAVYLFCQKYFVQGIATTGIK